MSDFDIFGLEFDNIVITLTKSAPSTMPICKNLKKQKMPNLEPKMSYLGNLGLEF